MTTDQIGSRAGVGAGTGERGPLPTASKRRVRGRRMRETSVDRVFLTVVYLLLLTFLGVVLVPLLYILASSFSDPAAVSSGRVMLWPVDFTLRGYQVVLADAQVLTGFANSLFYTVVGTLISVTLTVAIAYPLSRTDFPGGGLITRLVVFTMLFAGGVIPTYLVVQSLGNARHPLGASPAPGGGGVAGHHRANLLPVLDSPRTGRGRRDGRGE
jgi:putative aldouronate transport system permease protein